MKQIKSFMLIATIGVLLMKCSETDVAPEKELLKEYPSDVMVFKTQAEFLSTLETIKKYDTKQLVAFSQLKGVNCVLERGGGKATASTRRQPDADRRNAKGAGKQ